MLSNKVKILFCEFACFVSFNCALYECSQDHHTNASLKTAFNKSTRGQQWAQSCRFELGLQKAVKKKSQQQIDQLIKPDCSILWFLNVTQTAFCCYLHVWHLTYQNLPQSDMLTCCQQHMTKTQLVWTNAIKVRVFNCGIHPHCSSWQGITSYKLNKFLHWNTTVRAEHSHPHTLFLSICLHASAPPVITHLAALWAVAQNSILNVWMDLLTGISWEWLPTFWGPSTVCCLWARGVTDRWIDKDNPRHR